jgi:PKD repeat protein
MPHKPSALASALLVLTLLVAVAPGSAGTTAAQALSRIQPASSIESPGITLRVSVSFGGAQGNAGSYQPSISAGGYSVAFDSDASTLVPGDINGCADVFVRDWQGGTTERVSVDSDEQEVDGPSFLPSISANGQVVAFESTAATLVPGDSNGVQDVFVRDRTAGTTERVSVASDGTEANGASGEASISANGQYVAFTSVATNLVEDDSNACADIFVHDRETGATIRVSVASDGTPANGDSYAPSISSDGQIVAFESYADTLVADDTNDCADVFVHDRTSGTMTERVSVASDGTQGNYPSFSPSLSGDGRYVAFPSYATTLVSDDAPGYFDIFVHDRATDQTELVSISHDGSPEDGHSEQASISDDGRYVAFVSYATTLVMSDTNGVADIFVYDRNVDETSRVSVASDETESNGLSEESSISGTGRYVAFHSDATTLVSGDSNGAPDVFLHDRESVYDPPEAWFTANYTNGVAPLYVSFTNLSAGDYDTCAWRFGDQSTSDLCSPPPHPYTAKGVYSVGLTVSGLSGTDTVTRSHYISVYAPAQVDFAAEPTEGVAPLGVSFTNQSSGDYDTCAWDFGDDGTSADCNDPDHVYATKGIYTASLTISGLGGTAVLTRPHYITVYGPAQAGFTAEPIAGVAPLGVSFTNQSSGDYDTCAWDFGDDGTSADCDDPDHVYATKGVYTVHLTVSGLGGTDTQTRSQYITVYDPAVADFAASPTQGPAPLSVTFTNGSTGDYDTCVWRFGDGDTSGTCNDPAHTYTAVQPYTVSLTVSGLGGSDTLTRSRYITTYHPVEAGFTAVPTHGLAPLGVTFTNDSTGDYDACAWSFGDGDTSAECENPGHIYTVAGAYTPSLTVTGLGGSHTLTRSHYITAYGPVRARFWAAPTQGPAPLEVTFTNRSSGDYDTCAWGFGDGHTSSDCSEPTHVYTAVAAYTPTLTVTGLGGTHTLTRSHYITTYHAARARFTAVPTQGLTPLTVHFANHSTGEYDACAWDFGDNHASSDCDDPSHVYTTTGPCTVRLTVTGLGGTHSLTRTNYILPYGPARADFSASPTHGPTPLTVGFTNLSTGGYDTCAWSFGDGDSSDDCDDPTHVYTPTGAYTVSLVVSGLGGTHALTRTEYITVVPPTYWIYLPVIVRRSP